jgi:hypothetical protein
MGRTAGRTPDRLYAVATAALRPIRDASELQPGEVGVVIRGRRSIVGTMMPKPKPSDLAFEVWRLKTHRKLSYGQVAQHPSVQRYLAPRSKAADMSASRLQLAKKYVRQVREFLATPIGRIIEQSESWAEWLSTGTDPNRVQIIPFVGYRRGENFQTNYLDFRDARKR